MLMKIVNLEKTFATGKESFKALNNVNFGIDRGELGVILGPSGSGKSTLLNIIGGIDRASGGSVVMDDMDLTKLSDHELTQYRRKSVGFIFQFYNLIPNLTVYENVEVASNISRQALDIDDVLHSVGMIEFKRRFPRELSGGQQQRVSIARAIVKKPALLLCDEPTGALDFSMSKEILKLITDIKKEFGTTVLIVTHNTAISSIAGRMVRLRSGEVMENIVNDHIIPAERIEW